MQGYTHLYFCLWHNIRDHSSRPLHRFTNCAIINLYDSSAALQFRSSKNDILSDKFWTNMRNVWGIKAIVMAFWSAFSHKKEWGHLLERILHTSRYSITQELLQLLDEFSFSYIFLLFFWQASPVSEEAELHVPHTKGTCLARPVVYLNRTMTTFENVMFLTYLRMAKWFSPKSSIFSITYRMA